MQGWKNKLAAIFYGPSWEPGKPRLGLDEDKVKVIKFLFEIIIYVKELN